MVKTTGCGPALRLEGRVALICIKPQTSTGVRDVGRWLATNGNRHRSYRLWKWGRCAGDASCCAGWHQLTLAGGIDRNDAAGRCRVIGSIDGRVLIEDGSLTAAVLTQSEYGRSDRDNGHGEGRRSCTVV